jgi:hypothetical protein
MKMYSSVTQVGLDNHRPGTAMQLLGADHHGHAPFISMYNRAPATWPDFRPNSRRTIRTKPAPPPAHALPGGRSPNNTPPRRCRRLPSIPHLRPSARPAPPGTPSPPRNLAAQLATDH